MTDIPSGTWMPSRQILVHWLVGGVLLCAISWLDYAVGYEIRTSVFYFLPIWLLGWYVSPGSGLVMAILASVAWFFADYSSGHTYQSPYTAYWNAAMQLLAFMIVASSASIARKELLAQRKLDLELSEAAREIKHLQGLLATCVGCNRIRNENGEWERMESYISTHSEARFSHSICPECRLRLYPERSRGESPPGDFENPS